MDQQAAAMEGKDNFLANSSQYRSGPKQQRTCNDIVCLIIFIVMLLAIFIIGVAMIADQKEHFSSSSDEDGATSIWQNVFDKYGPVLALGFILAVVISIVYLLMLVHFTKCMVYFLLVATFVFLVVLLIVGIVYSSIGIIITAGIMLIFFIIFIICFRDKIELGIALLKVAATFVTQKISVYWAPVWTMIMSFAYFSFWLVSILAISSSANQRESRNEDISKQQAFYGLFLFHYIFMTFFLNYVMTFLIAVACAFWYYAIDDNYFCKGSKWMNYYHIGSFTFAAMVITIVTVMRMMVASKRRQSTNLAAQCCLCLIECCLRTIEAYLKILNENSVIVMSITGESYCSSARTTLYLIFENLSLFYVKEIFSTTIVFAGYVFAVGIPTIIGIGAVNGIYDNVTDQESDHVGLMIFFGSIILVTFFVQTLAKALSCVFIFFCFDKRMIQNGFSVNVPDGIRRALNMEYGVDEEEGRYNPRTNQNFGY